MRRGLGMDTIVVATALPAVIATGIAAATNRVELAARLGKRAGTECPIASAGASA